MQEPNDGFDVEAYKTQQTYKQIATQRTLLAFEKAFFEAAKRRQGGEPK